LSTSTTKRQETQAYLFQRNYPRPTSLLRCYLLIASPMLFIFEAKPLRSV